MKTILRRSVIIKTDQLNDIDYYLLENLKKNIEGRCISDGYVIEITNIISKTKGEYLHAKFDGSIKYNVDFQAEIFQINKNDVLIGCIVERNTPIGLFMNYKNFINIMVTRKNISSETADDIKINDVFDIRIDDFVYQLTQNNILVIGLLHDYYIAPFEDRKISFESNSSAFNYNFQIKGYDTINCLNYLGYKELDLTNENIPHDIWEFYSNYRNPLAQIKNKKKSWEYYHLLEIINLFEIPNNKISIFNEKFRIDKNNILAKKAHTSIADFDDIFKALKLQEEGGILIVKTEGDIVMTLYFVQIIELLTNLYSSVEFYQPESVLGDKIERYIICKNYTNKINIKEINDLIKNNDNHYIASLFTNNVSEYIKNWVLSFNITQQKYKNNKLREIIETIKINNLKIIEDTSEYTEKQKKLAEQWIAEYKI